MATDTDGKALLRTPATAVLAREHARVTTDGRAPAHACRHHARLRACSYVYKYIRQDAAAHAGAAARALVMLIAPCVMMIGGELPAAHSCVQAVLIISQLLFRRGCCLCCSARLLQTALWQRLLRRGACCVRTANRLSA